MDSNTANTDDERNASNITGWYPSLSNIGTCSLLTRTTSQCLVLIIYNRSHSKVGKFRNTVVTNSSILKAYGHGEFFGMAEEEDDSIECVEGYWCPYYGMGMLSFDNREEAQKAMESETEFRDFLWLGGVEMYIVPASSPCVSSNNYRYLQVDFYDVKNNELFLKYLTTLHAPLVKHGGVCICASDQVTRWRGTRHPKFILMNQWTRREDFHAFSRESANLLRQSGSACSSRIIFEIRPPPTQW